MMHGMSIRRVTRQFFCLSECLKKTEFVKFVAGEESVTAVLLLLGASDRIAHQ